MEQITAERGSAGAAGELPLVVDLDGTLSHTDTLVESFFAALALRPLAAMRAVLALRKGKAQLKARLAELGMPDVATLPLNQRVLDFVQAEHARGRRVYLATAANRRIAEAVAGTLGLFDGIFASDDRKNLSGTAKAAALAEAFGERGFDYIGNDAVDFAVWQRARGVLVADASPAVLRQVRTRWPDSQVLSERRHRLRPYIKAMRLHQWAKNSLLFVPALAAHRWGMPDLMTCLLGFLSFGLTASSVYVTNDLVDIERDRAHHTKRRRPLASGELPVMHGLAMAPVLLAGGVALAAVLGPAFLLVLATYYAGTLAYSLVLKRMMQLDVVTLAGLYGIRLYAGAVAIGVPLSAWLGTFALFMFTCLALVKRCAELIERDASGRGNPPGRDYRIGDLPVLFSMAAAGGFTAILVVALYAYSPAVQALYNSPNRLFLICVVLLYWLGRVLLLTQRNEMHDDPVLFAATDRVSQLCILACAAIVLASL